MTYLKDHKKYDSISLKIGTIRLLHDTVKPELWDEFIEWFDKHDLKNSHTPIIGTGGNINKLLKVLRDNQNDYFIRTEALSDFKKKLDDVDVDERMVKFILNPDRADVIVPASKIFLSAATHMDSREIYIPKVGLSDGIARQLYKQHKSK